MLFFNFVYSETLFSALLSSDNRSVYFFILVSIRSAALDCWFIFSVVLAVLSLICRCASL